MYGWQPRRGKDWPRGREEIEARQMTIDMEEVMGKEVVALLRGPGRRSAGKQVFVALGARGIWGLLRLSWDTPRAGTHHADPSTTTLTGALGVAGRWRRTRRDFEEESPRHRLGERRQGREMGGERRRDQGAGRGEPHLEVGELQVLVGLAALELLEQVAAGLRLSEGGQPLLAAPQALRPPQHPGQEAQLLQRRAVGRGGRGGRLPGRAAVAVAERLAVAQQAVQPHADLQVADALGPVLGAVLVQPVAIGRLQRHQLVPREAAEAVALVLRPRRRQQRRQRRHPHGCASATASATAQHHVAAAGGARDRERRPRGRAEGREKRAGRGEGRAGAVPGPGGGRGGAGEGARWGGASGAPAPPAALGAAARLETELVPVAVASARKLFLNMFSQCP